MLRVVDGDLDAVHRDADQTARQMGGDHLEEQRLVHPLMLDVLGLRAGGDGHGDRVVAGRQIGKLEQEAGGEAVPRRDMDGGCLIGDEGVVAEQRLAQPVLDDEADDRAVDGAVGAGVDATEETTRAPPPALPRASR